MDDGISHNNNNNQILCPIKPIRCIVKLGGAAITCKNEIEKMNEESLEKVSSQLRQAMISGLSSVKICGMDWSKRPGNSEASPTVDDFSDQSLLDSDRFIVVHGAGSFGHFQASKSGVHKGGLNQPLVKAGFVATRISVTTLNLEIVRALAREGIPSIGMSPFSCGWLTCERNVASADVSMVAKAIDSGFVPVLHGDAVLDEAQDCTILSGDVIIRHLAAQLKPEYVVFLITVAAHDTTGGMVTKIWEAAMIAKLGIDVYIVKAATDDSLRALRGELKGNNVPEEWLGTVIRLLR
ncbi:hypothetical protein PVL29_001065 [Vitis rotundifolia]|uniref:Isopentenyl phosphate kinase n=1 Tax=Vitis rotundifolia TaxID=103349 RepID=A0AA39ALT3_VITRO|nr:hypothetical protein PVL29_001065 [Vitis rotundifolia]